MRKSDWIIIATLSVGLLLIVKLTGGVKPATMKTYIIANDSTRVAVKGTSISSTGWCTTIWRGDVADTIICVPHLITEDNDPPQAEPARTIY